ncbi:serine/arginine repetitive matrix protein 1-like isoform X2 [Ranitomeya imitator]|uniref:serine/arginine repetitive matrix protein 1-like isoform X2 n=1 Tax=Ranitomeya imitator TaxID=111125 RepID=UPI0037E96F7C
MSEALEELLGKVRAAAQVRGEAWLQEKVAEILTDKGKASDPQDPSPCAKRVRSLGPRSPSPVPRNRRKVSSRGRAPPEASAGQCPSSEVPCPAENPFTLDTDLRYAPHNFGDEDLRIPVNVASWRRSENGPRSEDAGIVYEKEQKSRNSRQRYSSPSSNPRTDKAETCHSTSNGKDRNTTRPNNTEEESIELRIERLLQSCSAAIMQDQQEDDPSEPTPVSSSVPECDAWTGCGSPDLNLTTPDMRLLPNIHQHPARASIIVDPRDPYRINQGARSPSPSVSSRSTLHSHRPSSGRRRRRSRSTSRASISPRRIRRSRSSDHSRCSRSSRRHSSSTSSERVSSSSGSYGGQSKRHAETQESSHHSRAASQAPSHVASSGVSVPLSSVIPSSPAVFSGLTVWILGHSFIHWAEWRARQRCYGLNLSMSADLVRIFWFGIREQKWSSLMDQVALMYSKFPSPDVIIIHLGGNDIGKRATVDLIFLMKQNFLELRNMFPNTILIFSEIVPRLLWLKSESLKFCEKIRKRINRSMSKFMPSIGSLSFRHVDLEGSVPGLFQNDWVHLSEIGTDIFNLNLKAMVELALAGAGPLLPTVG